MIKLSKLTDYAVVILSELAQDPGARMCSVDLAARTALPEPTVAKVLKLLAKGELVTSTRGVNGGYCVEIKAATITIAQIVTVIDGPIALTACVDASSECCEREHACSMKGQWDPVNSAMQQALEAVTLADMMGRR